MPKVNPTVLVIDDDLALRASIGRLLRSRGVEARLFESIPDFLEFDPPDGPTCLVLDVRLPGQSGLEFQRELAAANRELPIIFITGHGDIPMSVQAIKGGAIEFLTKPFRDQDLVDAIELGLARDRARLENESALAALSAREVEILNLIAQGRSNKEIARVLCIAPETIKSHLKHIFTKLNVERRAQAVSRAQSLGLVGTHSLGARRVLASPGNASQRPPSRRISGGTLPCFPPSGRDVIGRPR
jgi:FixJ family two-component response regulator